MVYISVYLCTTLIVHCKSMNNIVSLQIFSHFLNIKFTGKLSKSLTDSHRGEPLKISTRTPKIPILSCHFAVFNGQGIRMELPFMLNGMVIKA